MLCVCAVQLRVLCVRSHIKVLCDIFGCETRIEILCDIKTKHACARRRAAYNVTGEKITNVFRGAHNL